MTIGHGGGKANLKRIFSILYAQVWLRYFLAIALTALAACLRWALPDLLAHTTPYLAFYLAVLAAAVLGGAGPGLLATLGSALCIARLFAAAPVGHDWFAPALAHALSLFLAVGIGISLLTEMWRQARQRERRHTQQLLQSATELYLSQQRFVAFMRHLPGAAWIKDLRGRYLFANAEAERIFHKPFAELQGKTDEEVFSSVMACQLWENDDRAMLEDSVQTTQTLRQPDGTDHHAIVSKFGVPGPDGVFAWIGALAYDVTARKRAETALADSQRRLSGIIDSAMDAIITIDESQRIVLFNPAAEKMFGCPAVQALGAALDVFIPQSLRQAHRHHIQQFGQTGHTARAMGHLQELRGVRADGQEFPIEASISQVTVQGHKLFSVILRDCTERAQAEAARDEAKAIAEEASRAKDHFLAVLSHELRTPLTPVLAGLPMVQQALGADHAMAETLEMMRRNVELEARLIDDLLDMTRIARGKLELHREAIDLDTIIRRAVEVCQIDINGGGLQLTVDAKDGPYIVNADAARLQQVFWNLLKNAIKFTPTGGKIGLCCQRVDGLAVIEISDSGVGIAPEILPHIFNAFEQGSRSVTRQFGGLGLGLAITQSLVEMHGGSITAYSDGKGKGATFRVQLPLVETVPQPETPAAQAAPPVRALRILLVEDHGDTARIMKRLLNAQGHQVQTAGDVATALVMAQQGGFDLLLSDLGLPDGSGMDLMRQLVAQGKAIRAIALSGYGQDQDIIQCRQAGFAAHLTKPINMEQLTRSIAAVMELPIADCQLPI